MLKPGGCLMIVDFKRPESGLSRALMPVMLHRGMPVGVQDLGPLLGAAGFEGLELINTQLAMLGYLRAHARK